MFKKHEFTCPDVIYLMDRQKKINRTVLTGYALLFLVGGAWVKIVERKDNKRLETTETPTENTE